MCGGKLYLGDRRRLCKDIEGYTGRWKEVMCGK